MADIVARAFAQKLGEGGKTAVVENRTGGGGTIAADFVAKSAPDGYTVLSGLHSTQSILPNLQKNGLSLGSIYALIALGYTMVYGILKFINFAHGEIFMLGAFFSYYIADALGVKSPIFLWH